MRSGPPQGALLRATEASAAGLAYSAGLCWASVCLAASFRPGDLSAPYWNGVPGLRTDTCGVVAFFMFGICLVVSKYLRLRERWAGRAASGERRAREAARGFAIATSETVAILATGLVIYLSVNAVTHPATLEMHATHLFSWPTEGTLRVAALLLCAASIALHRYVVARRKF